jgi:adenylate kinase
MNIVFIGSPGAGKGTQAKNICSKYGMCHMSTGDMLRDVMHEGSELGGRIKEVISAGNLIGDELILELVTDRIDRGDIKNGVIMDGFPRTLNQAQHLDSIMADRGLSIDYVIHLVIEDEVLIDRITGRFSCSSCGMGYHDRYKTLKVDNTCDVCGSHEFTRRSDDTEEVLSSRLRNFKESTKDLLDYYREKGLLVIVNGLGDILEVQKRIEDIWQTQVVVKSC